MANIIVPSLGESVSEATVAKWLKAVGDNVETDEPIVELETDKVTLEVNATASGVLSEIKVEIDGTVEVGDIIGVIGDSVAAGQDAPSQTTKAEEPEPESKEELAQDNGNQDLFSSMQDKSVQDEDKTTPDVEETNSTQGENETIMSPAAGKIARENDINVSQVTSSGKDGRITKGDVLDHMSAPKADEVAPSSKMSPRIETQLTVQTEPTIDRTTSNVTQVTQGASISQSTRGERDERRVPMPKIRRRIAARLKEAQNTAAILTTFNEVNMDNCMKLRSRMKDSFADKHGVKLGFMSFFVRAVTIALQEIPALNAQMKVMRSFTVIIVMLAWQLVVIEV